MKLDTLEWSERCYLYRLVLKEEEKNKKSTKPFEKENAYDKDMMTIIKSKLLGKKISKYLEENQLQLELLKMREDEL